MYAKNHLIAGISTLIIASELVQMACLNPPFSALSVLQPLGLTLDAGVANADVMNTCLFALGSLLPDIDTPSSMIRSRMRQRRSLTKELFLLARQVIDPFAGMNSHRTWTHSVWPVLVLLALSAVLPAVYWIALGYLVHLFWDSLSKCGVCWFYPFSTYRHYGNRGAKVKNNHKMWIYEVGYPSETVLTYSVAAVACVVLFIRIY